MITNHNLLSGTCRIATIVIPEKAACKFNKSNDQIKWVSLPTQQRQMIKNSSSRNIFDEQKPLGWSSDIEVAQLGGATQRIFELKENIPWGKGKHDTQID